MPKVLLLEDDTAQAKHIENALKDYGYQVVWVEAPPQLEQQIRAQRPDLAVLDMDADYATDALNEFEENPILVETPLLLLTSDVSGPLPRLHSREKLKYLPKPFHPQILDLHIQTMLHEICCQIELRNLQQKLTEYRNKFEHLTIIDELTGLFNQTFILNSLKVEFARAVRYNKCLSFMLMEVKNFRQLHDRFGAEAAGFVLKEVGRIIKESVRIVDIIGRFGENRFALILPESDADSAAIVAGKICQQISGCNFAYTVAAHPEPDQTGAPETRDVQLLVEVYLGLASFPGKNIERFDVLLEAAEHALTENLNKPHTPSA